MSPLLLDRQPRLKTDLRAGGLALRVAGVLAAVAMAALLITTTVRIAANSLWLYDALFERHQVSERTGITPEGLRQVGSDIQNYLANGLGPLQVETEVYGHNRSLFNEREVIHMADVKGLFDITSRVQAGSALFLLTVALLTIAQLRTGAGPVIARWVRNSALLTFISVVAVGAVSVVAFDPLFTLFHELAFRNDFWQLNSRTDLLVAIFPFGFWGDMTLLIGLGAVAEAIAIFAIANWALRCLTSKSPAQSARQR